jgi:hypothetical protein
VCDPACGSGNFLLAAARRLATHLVRERRGMGGEDERGAAMRDVVRCCMRGVDLDPLALDACRARLWIETWTPNRPALFLEAQVRCGNALLGATPQLLGAGVPDAAFDPRPGDDRALLSRARRRNRVERAEHWSGSVVPPPPLPVDAAQDTPEQLAHLERAYAARQCSKGFVSAKLAADAWCAAFFWRKPEAPEPWRAITTSVIWGLLRGEEPPDWAARELRQLAEERGFFHWDLEFPISAAIGER